jgi:glucan phosphoethanolaminetransferase (alkaline phosphatase superfamily)
MIVPPEITIHKRRWSLLLAGVALVCSVTFIAQWYMNVEYYAEKMVTHNDRDIDDVFGVGIVVAAIFLGWLIRELVYLVRLPREYVHFRRTFFRSIVPILSLVVIASSLGLGYPLTLKEKQVAREMPVFGLYDEVGRSDYRLLRERLKQYYQELKCSSLK